jgi:hypothetical protein
MFIFCLADCYIIPNSSNREGLEMRLGNAMSGTKLKNLDDKMVLFTPEICGLTPVMAEIHD